jgi:hypothetical protein
LTRVIKHAVTKFTVGEMEGVVNEILENGLYDPHSEHFCDILAYAVAQDYYDWLDILTGEHFDAFEYKEGLFLFAITKKSYDSFDVLAQNLPDVLSNVWERVVDASQDDEEMIRRLEVLGANAA